MNPDLCLPAANALGQWDKVKDNIFPPSFECILSSNLASLETFLALTCSLYIINVPEFAQGGGKLRGFLDTCTASLIMYFPDMQKDFGQTDKVVTKLIQSMVSARVVETDQDAAVLLVKWSELIKADFNMKNSLVANATQATLLQTVQSQSCLLNGLSLQVGELSNKNESMTAVLTGLCTAVAEQPKFFVDAMATAIATAISQVLAATAAAPQVASLSTTTVAAPMATEEGPQVEATIKAIESNSNEDDDVASSAPATINLETIISQFRQTLIQADETKQATTIRWKDLETWEESNKGLSL